MENLNAVKFAFVVPKSHVKVLLDISFDKDIHLLYPRLSSAPELVKVRGLADLEGFQELYEEYQEKMLCGMDILRFHQNIKFKLVEVDFVKQQIPFAEKKEIIEKSKE